MFCGAIAILSLALAVLSGCRTQLIAATGVDQGRVAEIQRAIADLRGLPFMPPTRVQLLDAEAMRAGLLSLRLSEDSLQMMRIWSLIDRAFGEPWKTTPEETARRLPTNTSFGVYSPEDDTLFLARTWLSPTSVISLRDLVDPSELVAEIVVTHELVHAWQHRHFPGLFATTTDVDRWSTWRALLEGDAEVTTLALTWRSIDAPSLAEYLAVRRRMALAVGQEPDKKRDWKLRYDRATRFAWRVLQERGWEGLNALLGNPPDATATVLRADENPKAALVPLPGSPFTCRAGWSVAVDTTVGAFHIPELLNISPATTLAIDGWQGDRLRICTREESDDFILHWLTRWDSGDSARRFLVAARAHLRRRYPEGDRACLSMRSWAARRGRMVEVAVTEVES